VGERSLHTREVAGSKPAAPTYDDHEGQGAGRHAPKARPKTPVARAVRRGPPGL